MGWKPVWWWDITELQRQILQQPLHIMMSMGVLWLMVKWLPMKAALIMTFMVVVVLIEALQWPSTRKWDPPLDIAFKLVGLRLGFLWLQ
jgi:hypothetical protein